MKMNHAMQCLLRKYGIDEPSAIPQNSEYPIWVKKDQTGGPYWGVSLFWNMDRDKNWVTTQDLSCLEWDGNEVYLNAENQLEVQRILKKAIGILNFWKNELETKYAEIPFCLFASYDNGDMQIVDEGEVPVKSVTMRFWADRGTDSVINLSEFDNWEQPAIIVRCNSR